MLHQRRLTVSELHFCKWIIFEGFFLLIIIPWFLKDLKKINWILIFASSGINQQESGRKCCYAYYHGRYTYQIVSERVRAIRGVVRTLSNITDKPFSRKHFSCKIISKKNAIINV